MTDITPSTYTSETSMDVTIPTLVNGTYSIDVTNSSGLGSGTFTVGPGTDPPEIIVGSSIPPSKIAVDYVKHNYTIIGDAEILVSGIVLSAGSPASIDTITQVDSKTVTLTLKISATGDVGLSATDIAGVTTTNIISGFVIYNTSPYPEGQGPGIKFTNHNTTDRFLLTNGTPGSVHVTITDINEMVYDNLNTSDWIVLVDGSVGEIDQTSLVQTTSAVVDFDIINISATGSVTISAKNFWDSFTNSETDGRWNVGCGDNDRLINLVDFLPQHLYDSETYDFTKFFENFLNTLYENKDDPCNVSILKKIEQIGDLHDPQLMDAQYLQYYADFLGYDLTMNKGELGNLASGVTGEENYVDSVDVDKYLRFVVENLPNWYKIKSTRNAIRIMLFSFGVVGDLFTLFTNDYDKNWLVERSDDNISIGSEIPNEYYPSPHFNVGVNLRETPPTWLNNANIILNSIDGIRPINTVFDRFVGYYTLDPANISVFASKPTVTQKVFIDWPNNTATCATDYTNMYSNGVDGNLSY